MLVPRKTALTSRFFMSFTFPSQLSKTQTQTLIAYAMSYTYIDCTLCVSWRKDSTVLGSPQE